MRRTAHSLACVVLSYVLFPLAGVVQGADAQALALLRGVEQARTSVPAGRVSMTIASELPPYGRKESKSVTVSYDGSKRTATQSSDMLIIPPANSEQYKKIARMQPEQAAKDGLGTLGSQDIKNAVSGQSYVNYWGGSDTAMSKNIARGPSDFAFDPRTLGISVDFSATIPLPVYLGYENCHDAQVVGQEVVNGVATSHVTVDTAHGTRLDLWIEDAAGFRVHRYRWQSGKVPLFKTCDSQYPPGDRHGILPSVVTIKQYSKDDPTPKMINTITADRFEFGPQSPPPGSVASLDLPVGTALVDDKSGKTIGYWSGKELSKTAPRPSVVPAIEPSRRGLWVWLAVGAGVALLVGLALIIRRRRAA